MQVVLLVRNVLYIVTVFQGYHVTAMGVPSETYKAYLP